METGVVSDGLINASSTLGANHSAHHGRLHFQAGAWSAAINDESQWIQVDLIGSSTTVTGVATQGNNDTDSQWVTRYRLRYSDDGVTFRYYKEQGQTRANDKVKLSPLHINTTENHATSGCSR